MFEVDEVKSKFKGHPIHAVHLFGTIAVERGKRYNWVEISELDPCCYSSLGLLIPLQQNVACLMTSIC